MKRLIASSPVVSSTDVRNTTERAPFTRPRALAESIIAISAWKTASAVILLFVLFVATSSPAHHDKRGAGHNLFNDRPRVGRVAVLTAPSDSYTTQYSLAHHRRRDLKVRTIAPHRIQDA